MPNRVSIQASSSVVALFPWGDLIEDFLGTINISFESFCDDMTGGWLFGYIDTLKKEEIQTTIFCMSAQVSEPTRYIHKPTGATICVLPSPRLHRWLRQFMKNPYGWELEETFGHRPWWSRPFWRLLKDVASYVANPIALLEEAVRHEQCNVILCQEYEYPRFDVCVLLGKRLNLPVFATFQGGNFHFSRLEKFIRPYTLKACAGLIVPSHVEIDRLHKTYGVQTPQVAKIFNPLDLGLWQSNHNVEHLESLAQVRKQLGIPYEATVVVWHGRVEQYRKGLDILLDAWIRLSCEHLEENCWLLLVGTGSDAKEIGDRIAALPKKNVCWVNEYILDRALMRQYLCASDIYVLPSRHEGFPVAPLEAMACGLPVVATEVPGIADILPDHENSGGIRVPCEDPTQLALALERLFMDKALRDRLGQHARQRVESHFSLASVGQQLKELMFSADDHVLS